MLMISLASMFLITVLHIYVNSVYSETDAAKALPIHWRISWLNYTVARTKHTYAMHKKSIDNDMIKSFMWIHQELAIQQQKKVLRSHYFHGVSDPRKLHCFSNRLFRRTSKKNIKDPRHWPLWRESTDDRWIPLTKGQLRDNAEMFPFESVIIFVCLFLGAYCW